MSSTISNDTKDQHVVPRHYLSAFKAAEREQHIWRYEVAEPFKEPARDIRRNPELVPLKQAGMVPHFYSVIDDDVIDTGCENDLKRVEDRYMTALQSLRAVTTQLEFDSFLGGHRTEFIECIMITHQRGFRRRLLIECMFDRIAGNPIFPSLSSAERRRKINESMFQLDERTKNFLASSRWKYFKAPAGKKFIVGDSPVVAALPRGGVIVMPISPEYVLAVVDKSQYTSREEVLVADLDIWRQFNAMNSYNSVQYIFHNKREEWVTDLPRNENLRQDIERMVDNLLANFEADGE